MDMLELGARNETRAQIQKTLSQDNIEYDTLLTSLQAFVDIFKEIGSFVDIRSANKIYPLAGKHIDGDYLEKVNRYFKAEITSLDYGSSPEESRSEINHGVEKETNVRIKDILALGSVTSSTMVIAVNARYFTDDIEGLYSLGGRLSSSMLDELMTQLSERKVVVNLPIFQMDTSYEMKDVLTFLGMHDMFEADMADLSGIGEGLFVTTVIHKAFVEVNEEGTEAAAATAMIMATTCAI
ncbi:serpin B3-like, partial [Ruditapes philippinarum]|uniref:serpin B3-like n=1 Tax=Ruditapes philippinarum TaxID=129788 RepID=UPI00295A97DA